MIAIKSHSTAHHQPPSPHPIPPPCTPSPNREKHGIWHWPLGDYCPMIFTSDINLCCFLVCLWFFKRDLWQEINVTCITACYCHGENSVTLLWKLLLLSVGGSLLYLLQDIVCEYRRGSPFITFYFIHYSHNINSVNQSFYGISSL